MRLTDVLYRFKPRLPRGDIWRGKYRLYRKVTPLIASQVRNAFQLEERNMFYLRHPYLTYEQSYGHAEALKKHDKWLQEKIDIKRTKWRDHRYLGDRIGFLKVFDSWE